MVIDQIVALKPDILCLQELDRYPWVKDKLSEFGYTVSVFHKRPGDKDDGCGTFLNPQMFQIDNSWFVEFKDKTKRIAQFVKVSFVKARSKKAKENSLLICNTHLYWDTDQPNLQLSQLELVLQNLTPYVDQCFAIIVCGDFNSSPEQTPFLYFSGAEIPKQHQQRFSKFIQQRTQYPKFSSAFQNYENTGAHPPFTAYQDKWSGCVDYIWFNTQVVDTLGVIRTNSLPSKSEVTKEIALPNSSFPSDHLPLFALFGC
uniref:Endonuclease/exonuclease/phosphatase domain-containing protein n=1 Tax=Arcella intermedia TaxID=1963864 RepID=A0A6B2LCQ0_9EUKA